MSVRRTRSGALQVISTESGPLVSGCGYQSRASTILTKEEGPKTKSANKAAPNDIRFSILL